jgi:ATP-binding cassette subfamily F protein uup
VVTSTLASEGNGKWVEYAGGYSDMLAQRGEAAAPEPVKQKTAGRQAALPQTRAAPGAKLSFKDQHELKTLTADIEKLQAEIKNQERKLAVPGLYNKDIKAFKAATNALADAQGKLAAAEERWLALELLKEAS